MAVGCVVLPFASRPLASWSGRLPDSLAPINRGLIRFDTAMAALGLTWPYDTLHAITQRVVDQPLP